MGHDTTKETDDLKALITEAHEVLKDCNSVIKAMKVVRDELLATADEVFEERIEEQAKAHLDKFNASMTEHIDKATDAVYARFDRIADILTGKGGDMDFNKIDVIVVPSNSPDDLPTYLVRDLRHRQKALKQ